MPYYDTAPAPGTTARTFYGQGQDLFRQRQNYDTAHGTKADATYRALGHGAANQVGTFGFAGQGLGYSNLNELLLNQGRMDPRIMAQQQGAISRGTRQEQTGAQGMLAQKGFGGSGLGAALQAAIGQGGQNRQADLRYRDSADAYARNQQNLGLMQQLYGDPMRDYAAIGAGQYGEKQRQEAQKQAGWLSLIGSLVGGLS